jgi:hypothetical protein
MNKKSLTRIKVIVTVILGAVVLSSCSHDEYYYSEENVERIANEKYAIAFEKAFGKVGPNVDWGFSSKKANTRAFTRAVGTYSSYRGNIKPSISFPTDCDASKFLAALPTDENVERLPKDGGGAFSWFIDAQTQSVSTWGASKIYVTGTVDLSNGDGDTSAQSWKFAPSTTSEIYLLKGSKLILGEASAYNFNVAAIYIAENATLETAGRLLANNSTKIYNHGTISVGSFEPNTSSFLYNVGTFTAGSVTAESNDSRIVNDGTLNCASVTVNAGAVQNNAEWTVTGTGTTTINSNNSGWVNNGHWETYDYVYISGSENVINNCYLEVKNDFEMNISSKQGAFKIDGGGGVLTKNFIGGGYSTEEAVSGPYVIVMGSNAVFVVKETAQLESGRYDEKGFGIFGPSEGGYAVFQAKNIVRDPYLASIKSHGAVAYGGNLYVSAETHFPQGLDSDGSGTYTPQPYIIEKEGFKIANNIYAEGFNFGKPSITIPQTPCSPGFIGGNPLYRVIAEDLSASESGDFDFNDVVFDVVKAENGKTTLKLICAGGLLPLRVRGANEEKGVEIHSVFGETVPNERGEYQMYNTGAGPTVPAATFTVEGEYTTPEEIGNIIVEVKKNNVWMALSATQGVAACKILVDDTFKPVRERRNIADENKKFTNYVQGKFENDFWWK